MIAEDEPESEFHRWASEQLELPRDALPAAVRGAFLRRLWADRFCPPASVRQAYEVLRGDQIDADPLAPWHDAWLEVQDRVRADVERFASDFFQVPPDARQARWENLARQAAPFPRVHARLGKLQFGLTVELKQQGNHALQVDRLVRACCALFVLRPTAQAMLRQSLQAEFADDPSNWALTAKLLLDQSPEIAALAPYLMEWLATFAERSEQTARAHRRAASAKAANWAPEPTRVKRAHKDPIRISLLRMFVLILFLVGFNVLQSESQKRYPPHINYSSSDVPTIAIPKKSAKPTIESVDTSLTPPEINTQAVELLDEKQLDEQRDIERRALELINEMLRKPREKAHQSQEKPTQNLGIPPADEPEAPKDPP